MELTTEFTPLPEVQADWLIIPIWEDQGLTGAVQDLDARLGGVLARLRHAGDLAGKANELAPLLGITGSAERRLLAVGLGKRDDADRTTLTDAAAAAARSITGKRYRRIAFALPEGMSALGWEEVARAAGVGLMQGCYGPGLRKMDPARFAPDQLMLVAPPAADEQVRPGTHRAEVEGKAVRLAKELVNLPPCDLYPETFAQRAREIAVDKFECIVLDENQLQAERMGSMLGVARGSDRPPRLLVLRHQGDTDGRTLGFVGKGVTFDSGGLSLKTNEQMLDMKCDMAGAAAVLAAVAAIAELRLPANVLGVIPLVENLPSGHALKLGDVLRARNGKTIEVLNTDAEGRLILADALTYAIDHHADHLIDLATLTGSCMVALGVDVAGLMSNNEDWAARVLESARLAGEKVWSLPMFPHYAELIKSHVADVKNVAGTRYGGAITAAKFLEHFVASTPWAHLDIAGPAWAESETCTRDPGGTGFGVRTLIELARAYA